MADPTPSLGERVAVAIAQLDQIARLEAERADDLADDHARWTSDRLARIATALAAPHDDDLSTIPTDDPQPNPAIPSHAERAEEL